VWVQSELTRESLQAIYAALGSDGQDFRCSVKGYVDIEEYAQLQGDLFQLFTQDSLTEVVRALDARFGEDYFTLAQLFSDEQRRLSQRLLAQGLELFEQQCDAVYRRHLRIIDWVRAQHWSLPAILRMAAQSSLNRDIAQLAGQLRAGALTPADVVHRLHALEDAGKGLQDSLNFNPLNHAFEAIIERHLALLWQDAGHAQIPRQALEVAQALKLALNLWRGQNLFWRYLNGETHRIDLPVMLDLGTRLGFNPSVVSQLLSAPPAASDPAASH
jgi:hypothetical protein